MSFFTKSLQHTLLFHNNYQVYEKTYFPVWSFTAKQQKNNTRKIIWFLIALLAYSVAG
ncbi:hypothetical protein KQQSB11_90008 [Klebsiella quasipneumoniae subsp. quasipneumoniae]|nr:hypothetical protein KQQSB11_90008 [Klebsiella quasipneumoniae subsp. quasipneumoniae]